MSNTPVKNALLTMLNWQCRLNAQIHEDWTNQRFEWYRAVWIECGELMDHYGYKWWKKQTPDMEQVRLEVIDIWHFGMSALLAGGGAPDAVADDILRDLEGFSPSGGDVRETTEALALNALDTRSFSPSLFWDLMAAAGLDSEGLYRGYMGKNVLNVFRQDHGYKRGTYTKHWAGREDNEHLTELMDDLDSSADNFADDLYAALEARYIQSQN